MRCSTARAIHDGTFNRMTFRRAEPPVASTSATCPLPHPLPEGTSPRATSVRVSVRAARTSLPATWPGYPRCADPVRRYDSRRRRVSSAMGMSSGPRLAATATVAATVPARDHDPHPGRNRDQRVLASTRSGRDHSGPSSPSTGRHAPRYPGAPGSGAGQDRYSPGDSDWVCSPAS